MIYLKKIKNNYLFFLVDFFDFSLTKVLKESSLSSGLSSSRAFSSEAAIVNSNSFFFAFQEINKYNYLFLIQKSMNKRLYGSSLFL